MNNYAAAKFVPVSTRRSMGARELGDFPLTTRGDLDALT